MNLARARPYLPRFPHNRGQCVAHSRCFLNKPLGEEVVAEGKDLLETSAWRV